MWEIGYEKTDPVELGDMRCKLPVVELVTRDVRYNGTLAVHEQGWIFDCVKTGQLVF
jgi:hypothetical protein